MDLPHPHGTDAAGHTPVLVEQVLALLEPKPGMVMLDCTLGLGGHAEQIIPRLAPGGRYVGLDVDQDNLNTARGRLDGLATASGVTLDLVCANFVTARQALDRLGVGEVDLLLADLGFSSNQMADPSRGLSFSAEGPLDMRLDRSLGATAADLVNSLDQEQLADLIYRYGEERLSRKIARKIVETRSRSPILTSQELAQIVRRASGAGAGRFRIDPATRTFMALRIAVNQELEALQELLTQLPGLLRPGSVAGVISFHSLEDRLVKRAFVDLHRRGHAQRLTAKPLTADEDERRLNPRSRSAKMRAIRWKQDQGGS